MTTVRDLITDSLRLISMIGAGETLSAEDANDGLSALNQMLSSWSADGQVIYSRSTDTKVLTSNVASYTMGPGGDIDTVRPVSITQATVTLGQIIYNLNLWAENTYSTLTFPTYQQIPTDVYINNGNPLLTLQFYPVPIGGLTLTVYSLKPLSSMGLDDVVDLPPGYERAIKYNLAVERAPEYERDASPTVRNIAFDSLQTIKRNNQQYFQPTAWIDPVLSPQFMNGDYWGFNIYGGY